MRKLRGINLHSIQSKLTILLGGLLVALLVVNLFIFRQVNIMLEQVNSVFSGNVTLEELGDALDLVETNVYEYLTTKSSGALENYYRYAQELQERLEGLNNRVVEQDELMLETNIRRMTGTYLEVTDETIRAKRGRNVEAYRESYDHEARLYRYISDYVYELNQLRFNRNSENYETLLSSMHVLEVLSVAVMALIFLICLLMVTMVIRAITQPLRSLADTAMEVAVGNMDIEVPPVNTRDEVGIVRDAFDRMLSSIRDYIRRQRESMENEARMKQRELSMEAHLKEAQLRYLQAQINPHFLFNSLNAGAQLAAMEDAESTGEFLSRLADFFRYNVKMSGGDSTLEREIEIVDTYIYILNVRFAGDITYHKEVAEGVEALAMPGLILQPLVENAVQHGIRDRLDRGVITLTADREEEGVRVSVADNGAGMTGEQIRRIMEGAGGAQSDETAAASSGQSGGPAPDSTGIALSNVIERLRLYYDRDGLLNIHSDGPGCGTLVTILLPGERAD